MVNWFITGFYQSILVGMCAHLSKNCKKKSNVPVLLMMSPWLLLSNKIPTKCYTTTCDLLVGCFVHRVNSHCYLQAQCFSHQHLVQHCFIFITTYTSIPLSFGEYPDLNILILWNTHLLVIHTFGSDIFSVVKFYCFLMLEVILPLVNYVQTLQEKYRMEKSSYHSVTQPGQSLGVKSLPKLALLFVRTRIGLLLPITELALQQYEVSSASSAFQLGLTINRFGHVK